MSKKIVVKKPNEKPEVIETDKVYRYELKECIGTNYLPELSLLNTGDENNRIFIAADEEGFLRGLALNFFAKMNSTAFPVQMLVGTIVFTKIKPVNVFEEEIEDYEIETLSDEDIEKIFAILSEENQATYKAEFAKRYNNMNQYLRPVITKFHFDEEDKKTK